MARPKKDESIRRTNNVMVRFTDVEYAFIKQFNLPAHFQFDVATD